MHDVLHAWSADEPPPETCGRLDFHRAAQALGALGVTSRIPKGVELDSMFDVMLAGKERLELTELLKKPLEPRTFEVSVIIEEEEDFDPDDCFEDFGMSCMACNAPAPEGKKLMACQRCKRVRYCSRKCQLTGWRRGHKESCGKCLPRPSKLIDGTPRVER